MASLEKVSLSLQSEIISDNKTRGFNVPPRFVGHVYINGAGGDQSAVFAVGSDGNGNIAGGFCTRVGASPAFHDVGIRCGDQATQFKWEITGVKSDDNGNNVISIYLVGLSLK